MSCFLLFVINRCSPVVAIDIDPVRMGLAMNNAMVYIVVDRVDFVVGDFIQLAPSLKVIFFFVSLCHFYMPNTNILTLLLLIYNTS